VHKWGGKDSSPLAQDLSPSTFFQGIGERGMKRGRRLYVAGVSIKPEREDGKGKKNGYCGVSIVSVLKGRG